MEKKDAYEQSPEGTAQTLSMPFVSGLQGCWVPASLDALPILKVYSRSRGVMVAAQVSIIRQEPNGDFVAVVFYADNTGRKEVAVSELLQ